MNREKTVLAELAYLAPTTVRPFNYLYKPPEGTPQENCTYDVVEVDITDARSISPQADIHIEGFTLWDAPTAVDDFTDEVQIHRWYYPETAELAKSATGASKAFIFDHLVRKKHPGPPVMGFGRRGDGSKPGAVRRVHNDYTEVSGLKRLGIEAENFQIPSSVHRFAIVNIWRSIGGKIQDTPLAVCDARTVCSADAVTTDLHYRDRTGEIYLFQQSAYHRWSYFSEMDRHEALIFKQYDSQLSGVARFTPHSAFDLPDMPPDSLLRQSIEIRCLLIFE